MYFSDLLRGLLRRWYVIIAGLLLTGGGAYLVFDAVPVRYEANATMMLLPPEESLGVEGSNPYLILGGMGQALAVLTTRLNSPATRDALLGDDVALDYGVTADTSSGAPFLEITAQTAAENDALSVIADVQEAARAELERMQTELDIPTESIIGIMDVTIDTEATRLATTRTQLTLASAAVGAVLTIVAAATADGLLAVRRRRRAAANAPAPRERDAYEPLTAADVLAQEESSRPRRTESHRRDRRRRSNDDEHARDESDVDEPEQPLGHEAADDESEHSRHEDESIERDEVESPDRAAAGEEEPDHDVAGARQR